MKINVPKVSTFIVLPFLLLAFVLVPAKTFAAVDTCTWTGTTNSNTNNAGNWTGCDNGNLPEVGDSLMFPSTATNKTVSVNGALDVHTATFSGGVGGYSLTSTGSPFLIRSSFVLGSSVNTINAPITFDGAGSRLISSQATGNSFTGNILLTGVSTMNVDVTVGNTLTFSGGIISGSVSNFLIGNGGTGTVELNGANTFLTTNNVFPNITVRCGNATCFGNPTNGIILSDAGIIDLTSAVTLANQIETIVYTAGPMPALRFSAAGTFSGQLTITDSTNISVGTSTTGTLSGNIIIASGQTAIFTGMDDPAFERIIQNGGVVSGDGSIRVSGVRLELQGTNTYTGVTTVNTGGFIQNYNSTGLGTTAGATIIESGGAMFGLGTITVAENITISGNGATGWRLGALGSDSLGQTYTGIITLAGDTVFITPSSGQEIAINGAITGTGNLEMRGLPGSGRYSFRGSDANTYVGATTVQGVVLTLNKSGSAIAVPGNLNVIAVPLSSAKVFVIDSSTNNIFDSSVVTLTNSGVRSAEIESYSNQEIVGAINGNGHIESDGGSYGITVGGGNTSGAFSGTFDNENGSILKVGTGTWDLTGATFSGGPSNPFTIQINGGSVIWNAELVGMPVTVNNTATLRGTGTAGATTINSGGNINVGTSPGCMTLASLTMNAGSIFTQEIAGATACTGYDQTTVGGAAALNGTLTPIVTIPTVAGNVLTIITAGSVTGIFTGLADSATFVANSRTYRINYTATTVTLTDVTPAPVFSGGGGSYSMGGCRDVLATNYERYATFQSGTCLYARGVNPTTAAVTSTATATSTVISTAASSTPVVTSGNGSSVIELFNTNLRFRASGNDVKRLQQFLNAQGFVVSKTGVGSVGNESTYFGIGTRAALVKFQEKYTAEILTPNGLAKGSGLFFTSTRAQVNKILRGN